LKEEGRFRNEATKSQKEAAFTDYGEPRMSEGGEV